MINVIMGRLSADIGRADRRVHLFNVHQVNGGSTRKALCGFVAHHSVLELVPEIAGMGCERCIAEVPLDGNAASTFSPPESDPTSPALYGVGLRGEFVWHDAPERPLVQTYEGRAVIVAECGCIAFLVFGTPSPRYERCPDCP